MEENMKKRRKPVRFEQVQRSAGEIAAGGCMCAWDGCGAHYEGDMPPDWRSLIKFWAPVPDVRATLASICTGSFCDRDAVLCPKHNQELEGLLVPLGRWTGGKMAGEA